MEVGAGGLHLGLALGLKTCQGQHTMLWPLLPVNAHLASYSQSLKLFQREPVKSIPREMVRVCTMLFFVQLKLEIVDFPYEEK